MRVFDAFCFSLMGMAAAFLLAGQANAGHNPPPLADPIPGAIPQGPVTVVLEDVATGLAFPTDVEEAPDGSGRLFVTLRDGRVVIIKDGSVLAQPFIDISATTVSNAGSAMSSIAFHPEFAVSGSWGEGKVYTISQEAAGSGDADFSDGGTIAHQSVLYEWRASAADPDVADPASRREVLRIDENTVVHNLDELAFGPDGLLYATKGDDDMPASGVIDATRIHGSVLRIDVDNPAAGKGYGIPPGNPFVGNAEGRIEEIFAYGFRNPWRLSFDRGSGDLYVADIGEDDIEEVDLITSGQYYGWIDKEGSFLFLNFNGVTDDLTDLDCPTCVDPIAEYDHTELDQSITGGFVYRGTRIPALFGHYVFGDWVSGRLMHMDPATGFIQEIAVDPSGASVTPGLIGFGEDVDGELLIVIAGGFLGYSDRIVSIADGGLTGAPVLDPIGDQAVDENQQLVLSLSATDPNDDGLTMTASNMPTGATFVDHGDGTATFTWTPTFAQSGNYKVTFTTIDDGIPVASDTEEITITVGDVNRPPDLAPVGNRQVDEGQELTILLSASDPEDDTLAMTVAGLPAGASFQDNGGGAAEFRWTPGFDQAGNHQVTFFATDDGSPNLSDSEEITITVGEVNRPPVLSPVGNRNATVGEELVIALSAADPDGDSLAFSVVNAPAGGDLFDNGDGTAEFRWTPANGQGGNHQATFAVTDNGQPQLDDTEEITITVGEVNRPPRLDKIRNRSVKLGEQFSFPLQASDPDGDGLAFSAIGAPAGASLIDNGDGTAVFTWQPGDGQTGKHKVTFVVTDDGTPPASDSEQITINVVQDKKGRRKRGAARLGN